VIKWDEAKDKWLQETRGISFQELSSLILSDAYMDVLENPSRPNQSIFVLRIEGYVWVVPFIMDSAGDIFLKTAYPSRKMTKRYGGNDA
jgi:uncharacterized DUF497 family protein